MNQTKFIYLVVDRHYMKSTFSTVRALRFAKPYDDVMKALNYIMNVKNDDLIIITMLDDQYAELKERIEKLCF